VGLPDPNLVPSRRVRDPPGGKDSLKNFWDAPDAEEEFKPTRRYVKSHTHAMPIPVAKLMIHFLPSVRDQPGGQDNIGVSVTYDGEEELSITDNMHFRPLRTFIK